MSWIARFDTQILAAGGSWISLSLPDPFLWTLAGGVLGTAMVSIEMSGANKQRLGRAVYSLCAAVAFTEALVWLLSLPENRVVLTAMSALTAYFSWSAMKFFSRRGVDNLKDFWPWIKGQIITILGGKKD